MKRESGSPCVTIVIVARERFSYARESLASIFEHTRDVPYELVYVDGGSPARVRKFLIDAAEQHDFTLVRTPHYLPPNRARNLGLQYVWTQYVVFCDNDVIVSPGWLSALVECAEETAAAIVTPLTCEGSPLHQVIHCAGGESGWVETQKAAGVKRFLVEKMYLQKRFVAKVREQLSRGETGLAEFHCMLVRTDLFAKLGRLDEAFLNTKEHVDFSMAARQSGERIFFEPASVVTYIFDKPLAFSDYPYFMLRWSDAWEVSSLARMREKWRLDDDGYFANRISNRGWRRNLAIWRPVANMLSFGRKNRLLSRALFAFDRFVLNHFISERYRREYGESTVLEPAVRLSKAQQTRGNEVHHHPPEKRSPARP